MRTKIGANGYEALVYMFPFAGDIHRFNDHKHARNFVRYLFSKSGAHQANDLTPRNFVCEADGAMTKGAFNKDPDAMLSDFMRRRFPARGADKSLCDDGFYAIFAIRFPDGRAFSNFFISGEHNVEITHPLTEKMDYIGVYTEAMEQDIRDFAVQGPVTEFEDETDPTVLEPIEKILHGLVHTKMDSPGDVILSVSHRDQLDHNQTWHIHRLISLT